MAMILAAMLFTMTFFTLVLIHELGHYVAAKLCGIKVEIFSIGFGKPLLQWKEFVLARFPLGGYVKLIEDPSVSRLKRAMVILAGPSSNFLIAILCYWLALTLGITHVRPIVGYVVPGSIAAHARVTDKTELPFMSWSAVGIAFISHMGEKKLLNIAHHQFDLSQWRLDPLNLDWLNSLGLEPAVPAERLVVQEMNPSKGAAQAGIKVGDVIITAQGQPVYDRMMLLRLARASVGNMIRLTFEREGQRLHAMVPVGRGGDLGITLPPIKWPSAALQTEHGGLYEALQKSREMLVFNIKVIIKLVKGELSLQNLSGPVGIFAGSLRALQQGFPTYLSFLAVISLGLGVINLLPIPALDGARLLYLMIPLSPAAELLAFRLGTILLGLLMVHVFIGDILRLLLN
ncbi:MAG: RIP metalloprotease RseP [Gammaproteobacteria bacterium]